MTRSLVALVAIYAGASLVHFVHNAEFIADYPNLPASWTRADIYFAWIAMTAVGAAGWMLVSRGWRLAGLALLVVYAALGLDSLGHYVLAPMSRHTLAMNATILMEVTAAALVMVEAARELMRLVPRRGRY